MAIFSGLLTGGLAMYLHALPEFKGKRRLLLPLTRLLKGVPIRSRYGVTVGLNTSDRTNWYGVTGRYGNVIANEIERLKEGDCFVDVGANCGIFSLLARRKVGRSGVVIAFEPVFETFAELVSNIQLNRYDNIYPFLSCVSDHSGVVRMTDPAPGHSGLCAVAQSDSATGAVAACLDMSDFPVVLSLLGERPTIVKVDVEGYELTALRGLAPILARKETHRVIVEIDNLNLGRYGATVADVYEYLKTFGFEPLAQSRHESHFDEVFSR